jgi:hypothetical protein
VLRFNLTAKSVNEGRFAHVPILIGENEDEGSIWCFTSLNVTTDDEFSSYVQSKP